MTELGRKAPNFNNKSGSQSSDSAKPQAGHLPFVFAMDQDWAEAQKWIERIGHEIWGFKIGSILFTEHGPELVRVLKQAHSRVFLDLKFHDIPNTVSGAVRRAFDLGVDWVSVHVSGGPGMLREISKLQSSAQHILGITVLTSMEQSDLNSVGVSARLNDHVGRLADLAIHEGLHGLVCSVHEVTELRKKFPSAILLTPGIRLVSRSTSAPEDQKRTSGIREALEAGASHIVLGRALYESKDWKVTWEEIKSSLVDKL